MEIDEKPVTSESEDDSSSSSSEDEEEKLLEKRADSLEASIRDNTYQYEVHSELVEIYRKLGDLDSMRAAYERFSSVFPLTPKIWLEWIIVEKKYSKADDIKALFERAVKDYASVDLWLEYVLYSISHCSTEDTLEVFNRGISAVGHHFQDGDKLWGAFTDFQKVQLSSYKELSEEWNKQLNIIVDIYKRRLSIPLRDLEETHKEFDEIVDNLPDKDKFDSKSIEWGYGIAIRSLEIYKPFEERLLETSSEDELLQIYREYIDTVKEPVIKLCLYERAVAHITLCPKIWSDYCFYAIKLGDVALEVTKKAIRNCSWCEDLWMLHMWVLELQNYEEKDIRQCLEDGLLAISPSPGLNLWFTYIEYVKRTQDSKEHLNKLMSQAAEQLEKSNGDPTYMVLRFQAKLYAKEQNMKSARQIWSQILANHDFKRSPTAWLEYAALEKQYGDPKSLRKLYNRAIALCSESSSYIMEDWIMFERECGSFQDILDCMEKYKKISEVLVQQQQEFIVQPQVKEEVRPRNKKRSHDTDTISEPKQKSTKLKENEVKRKFAVSDFDTQKSVFVSNMRDNVNEEALQNFFPKAVQICIPDHKNTSKCFGYVQFESEAEVAEALARDRELLNGRPLFISKCVQDRTQRKTVFKYATGLEKNKLFVRGLPLNFSQEDVENIFKPHNFISVRLVTKLNGQPKGLAYVEFANEDDAAKALKATNELEINGRVITVAISQPPSKQDKMFSKIEEPIRHSRSRLQVPLVPRSVTQSKVNLETNSATAGPSKSNSDFRKMLLGIK